VGGDLYLRSVTALPEGFNPTVGGGLYLGSVPHPNLRRPSHPFRWNGHILADGILAAIKHEHGNVLRVQIVGKKSVSYLVTDETNWSHGDTLDEARESLIYKATDRNPEIYRSLTLDSELTFAEAVACYRTLTGACAAGVRHFMESTGATKDSVSLRKMIEITHGRYGHEAFVQFFAGQSSQSIIKHNDGDRIVSDIRKAMRYDEPQDVIDALGKALTQLTQDAAELAAREMTK
jgi:hypothetical protein